MNLGTSFGSSFGSSTYLQYLDPRLLMRSMHELELQLHSIGQLALEVECRCQGLREFVSLYGGNRSKMMNADARFYYFSDSPTLYRVSRFRVQNELLESGRNVGPEDLFDHQQIYLPNIGAVEYIFSIWKLDLHQLVPPNRCDIPI